MLFLNNKACRDIQNGGNFNGSKTQVELVPVGIFA